MSSKFQSILVCHLCLTGHVETSEPNYAEMTYNNTGLKVPVYGSLVSPNPKFHDSRSTGRGRLETSALNYDKMTLNTTSSNVSHI